MVILSVDYGDARTGVAVCDKNEFLASPVCVIRERRAQAVAERLAELVKEYRAQEIVIGLPKNMDGTEGFRAQACRELGLLVAEKTGIVPVFSDERLTTVSAYTYMNMSDTRGKKRKETVDAVAAVIILEDYLRYRKNKGIG